MKTIRPSAALLAFALGAGALLPPGKAAAAPAGEPSYRWFEASYGVGYYGLDDFRVRADRAWRLSTQVEVAPSFFVLASYHAAEFVDQFSLDSTSVGLGLYAPLSPGLHGILALTYEKLEQADESGSGFPDIEESGLGYEVGLRLATGRAGIDFTYKLADLEGDLGGSSFKDKLGGFNLGVQVALDAALSLSLRLEQISSDDDDPAASPFSDVDLENYLVGLRLNF